MVLAQTRYAEQWSRIKDAYICPCNGNRQTFGKDAKNILQGKDSIVNKWRWENWVSTGISVFTPSPKSALNESGISL